MSTIEDFENAPAGTTATHETMGIRVMKINGNTRYWITPKESYLTDEEVASRGFTLDAPAPATASEALDLAWELAHRVKPGQVIPEGALCLEVTSSSGLEKFTATCDIKVVPGLVALIRTLEPLPDPEPDWLDAPAVLASHPLCADTEPIGLWIPAGEGMWEWPFQQGEFKAHWSELEDVTPLYPKEGQEA